MNIQGIINSFFLLLPITLAITSDYVFEFGVDQGNVIYNKDGTIFFLNPVTSVEIPVPEGVSVTYVKVTVNALSPPKVDYDNLYHKVNVGIRSKKGSEIETVGARVEGDVLSYHFKSYIPVFRKIQYVIVKPQRKDVENNFTYLKVEYVNKITAIVVLYNATKQIVLFGLRYPFIRTPYEITGYSRLLNSTSKPLNETSLLNSTSKPDDETSLLNSTSKPLNQTIRSFKWDLPNLYDLIKDLIY
ncbi:unnamed protein product [Parnassius apollo]|uniref:(apollo) hypothetical protein n=1 Tax=Parnassius apollo TaxID=110799 RepID=A0A8S3WER4_PARAO|nr:unnamed protein product [Parnassius apollo]